MKRIQGTSLILFVTGILLMSSSFILQRFAPISDGIDGFIKGIAIGLMLLALIIIGKRKPTGA